MKFRLFLSLIFISFQFVCNAQTIHWIIFVDTSDWQLGTDNKNGKQALESSFISKVNAALEMKGYHSKTYAYTGSKVTPAMCNSITKSLSCGAKDIVVFYYIGHGGRPETVGNAKGSPWPEMEFTGNTTNYISLNTIHQRLKSKKPQLVVTIGMCCNIAKPSHKQATGLSVQSRKSRIVSKDFAKKIQRLFTSYRGDIQVAAASSGQEAQGGFKYGNVEMDYFTGTLCMLMDNYASSPRSEDITWSRFLGDLKYWTHYHVKEEQNYEQNPFYKINVVQIK